MNETLAFNSKENTQTIDKQKISIDKAEIIRRQKAIWLKTDFIWLNEIFGQLEDLKDLKQNGFVDKDEFFMTNVELEAKKQQVINKINGKLTENEIAKQELINIIKDLIIPEWYEIPLMILPIAQEWIILTRSAKIIKAIEKFEKNYDKIKLLMKDPKWIKVIEEAIDDIRKNANTERLEAIVNVFKGSKSVKWEQIAKELEWLKKEIDVINKEKTIVQETIKTETKAVKEMEKTNEVKEWINTYRRLEDNLNPYFWRWKIKYNEAREDILKEVEKFKARNNIKDNPEEVKKYLEEFRDLLKSHKKNSDNIKTIEDAINFLKINY